MRDINRLDIFYDELKEYHKKLPDWRFGQFITNFMGWYYQKTKRDCFYIEDDKIIAYIQDFVQETIGEKI